MNQSDTARMESTCRSLSSCHTLIDQWRYQDSHCSISCKCRVGGCGLMESTPCQSSFVSEGMRSDQTHAMSSMTGMHCPENGVCSCVCLEIFLRCKLECFDKNVRTREGETVDTLYTVSGGHVEAIEGRMARRLNGAELMPNCSPNWLPFTAVGSERHIPCGRRATQQPFSSGIHHGPSYRGTTQDCHRDRLWLSDHPHSLRIILHPSEHFVSRLFEPSCDDEEIKNHSVGGDCP